MASDSAPADAAARMGSAAGTEPRRAGGVAGPPGTTAGGLAGLLRAEPPKPTGSVNWRYASSSAAAWARAQPRSSGGADARYWLTAWWRSSRSSGEALVGRPSWASSSFSAAADPGTGRPGPVMRDLPGGAGGKRARADVRCILEPSSDAAGDRGLTPALIVRGKHPCAHPSGRTFRPGPAGAERWRITRRACTRRYRPSVVCRTAWAAAASRRAHVRRGASVIPAQWQRSVAACRPSDRRRVGRERIESRR